MQRAGYPSWIWGLLGVITGTWLHGVSQTASSRDLPLPFLFPPAALSCTMTHLCRHSLGLGVWTEDMTQSALERMDVGQSLCGLGSELGHFCQEFLSPGYLKHRVEGEGYRLCVGVSLKRRTATWGESEQVSIISPGGTSECPGWRTKALLFYAEVV